MKYITPPSTPAAGDVLLTNETDGEYRLVRVLCVVKHGTAMGEAFESFADHNGDRNAALRLCALKVAAMIGEGME